MSDPNNRLEIRRAVDLIIIEINERISSLEEQMKLHDAWERKERTEANSRIEKLEDFFDRIRMPVQLIGWGSIIFFGSVITGMGLKAWHFVDSLFNK